MGSSPRLRLGAGGLVEGVLVRDAWRVHRGWAVPVLLCQAAAVGTIICFPLLLAVTEERIVMGGVACAGRDWPV